MQKWLASAAAAFLYLVGPTPAFAASLAMAWEQLRLDLERGVARVRGRFARLRRGFRRPRESPRR